MRIKIIDYADIPRWLEISREYDRYILDIVPNLTEWYEGDGNSSISFDNYMDSKISKGEAFMAIDRNDNCCGIVAVSISNNRITFFGISHKCDFFEVGNLLLEYAMTKFDASASITTNIVKSNAQPFQNQHVLFGNYDFLFLYDGLENGVPVSCMVRKVET